MIKTDRKSPTKGIHIAIQRNECLYSFSMFGSPYGSIILSTGPFAKPKRNKGSHCLLVTCAKDLLYLETESEDQIAAVHIRRGLRGTDRVILYSHGNAEDLGQRLYLG